MLDLVCQVGVSESLGGGSRGVRIPIVACSIVCWVSPQLQVGDKIPEGKERVSDGANGSSVRGILGGPIEWIPCVDN